MCYAGKDRVQQQVPGSACHDTCHQEQRAIACGAVTSSFERARNISPNTISAGVLILEDYLQQQRPSLAGVWEMVCLGLAVDASGLETDQRRPAQSEPAVQESGRGDNVASSAVPVVHSVSPFNTFDSKYFRSGLVLMLNS